MLGLWALNINEEITKIKKLNIVTMISALAKVLIFLLPSLALLLCLRLLILRLLILRLLLVLLPRGAALQEEIN